MTATSITEAPAPTACHPGCPAAGRAPGSTISALPAILARANEEIQAVLSALRENRTVLETATVANLQQTGAKLKQVTSATECAATDILDALDRAGALVDELEAADQAGEPARAQATRDLLREEIFGMMGALQFQDITTQQLAHAASLLTETENRLFQIAQLFDPSTGMPHAVASGPDPRTFDPGATTRDAEQRQSLADSVFG